MPSSVSENPVPEETASVPHRVWRGTTLLVGGRLWGAFTTAVALLLLSRHLPTAEFGRFTFYLAVFAVLNALVDFGTSSVAVQRSAHDPWAVPGVVAAVRRLRLGMASLGFVFVAAGALAFGEPGAGWILLAALYPFTHALEISGVVFRNRIDLRVPVAVRAVASAAKLAFVLVVYWCGVESAALYVVAIALGSTLDNVLLHRLARSELPRPTIPVQPDRGLLRAAAPLGVAALCQQAYFYVDNLFVRALEGDTELAWYNGGVRLMSFGIMAAVHATQAALPWLSRRTHDGDLGAAISRLGQPLFAAACLAAGLAWPHAGAIMRLVFGEGFEAGGASLGWLILATAAGYAGAPLITAVIASGRARTVLVVAAGALLVNVAGNAILIPRMGIAGAGLATFVTEMVVALGAMVALMRAGARPLADRPWLWLLGPLLFALGAWIA
ncbi:MAG: oligosaccharide flippase family protein [Planctomycetota bacterium]|nr:oligosaccharide flippase family protein [Planctomycetota bacterium]